MRHRQCENHLNVESCSPIYDTCFSPVFRRVDQPYGADHGSNGRERPGENQGGEYKVLLSPSGFFTQRTRRQNFDASVNKTCLCESPKPTAVVQCVQEDVVRVGCGVGVGPAHCRFLQVPLLLQAPPGTAGPADRGAQLPISVMQGLVYVMRGLRPRDFHHQKSLFHHAKSAFPFGDARSLF